MAFMEFSGRKVMVIGASSGIGKQTALLLSNLGASVILVGRSTERLETVKEEMHNKENHLCIPYDVTDVHNCKELFDQAVFDGRKLDGLVYSTGIAKAVPMRVMSYNEFENIFITNFYGFVNSASMYSKKRYNRGGSIVAISAINAHYPQKCMTLYAASKLAIEGAVKTMAIELADQQIRINAVIPGAVDTPMSEAVNREILNKIISKQLLGIQKPEQIANFIVFLLSEQSSGVTGRSLYIDGGMLGQ